MGVQIVGEKMGCIAGCIDMCEFVGYIPKGREVQL